MCSLQHAFHSNNLLSLAFKIVEESVDRIPSIYSNQLQFLIDALLTKDPEERYSAKHILDLPFINAKLHLMCEGSNTIGKELKKLISKKHEVKRRSSVNTASPSLVTNSIDRKEYLRLQKENKIKERKGKITGALKETPTFGTKPKKHIEIEEKVGFKIKIYFVNI